LTNDHQRSKMSAMVNAHVNGLLGPRRTAMPLIVAVALVVLLANQALACLAPSPMEMGDGRAMDCCTESCRMDPTPEAAKQACQQSRVATGQEQLLAGSAIMVIKAAMKEVVNTELPIWNDHVVTNSLPTSQASDDTDPASCRTVDRYLLTRSLRI
jgi:hypothetical protein